MIFQMKFIEPEGADRFARLRSAVNKEVHRISTRQLNGEWLPTAHYILITNINLSADQRTITENDFADTLSTVKIHTLSGDDVCDLLDVHPELRRSFPQLLSLRDLDALLEDAVAKDVRERSYAAIAAAKM